MEFLLDLYYKHLFPNLDNGIFKRASYNIFVNYNLIIKVQLF